VLIAERNIAMSVTEKMQSVVRHAPWRKLAARLFAGIVLCSAMHAVPGPAIASHVTEKVAQPREPRAPAAAFISRSNRSADRHVATQPSRSVELALIALALLAASRVASRRIAYRAALGARI